MRVGVRSLVAFSVLIAFTCPAAADEMWIAPTLQQDLGGLGIASNVVWPVTVIGASRPVASDSVLPVPACVRLTRSAAFSVFRMPGTFRSAEWLFEVAIRLKPTALSAPMASGGARNRRLLRSW